MMVYRGSLQDVYIEEGRSAVFVRDQVIVLSEIATAILEATPAIGSVSLTEITRKVVDTYGDPEPPLDATDVTHEHVLELVAHEVLRVDSAAQPQPFTPDSVEALRGALRHLLSHDTKRWQLPRGVTGSQLVSAAERHRVVPTLTNGLDRLLLPAHERARLGAITAQEAATVAVMGAELAELVDALERAGVRVLAFKGLALAVQAHGDVAARGTGDHDLLVSPSELERAYDILQSLGWKATGGFPRPSDSWAWSYFVRTYYELSLARRGHMIDLHWHVGPVRAAFPSFDELWERHQRVRIHDKDIPTLSPYDALAHSASHSAKDHWRWLRGLLDVWLLMQDDATWRAADRPLRHDQLLSLGLAARLFGVPVGVPSVVHDAERLVTTASDAALVWQARPAQIDVTSRIPGVGLLRAAGSLRRAGASEGDLRRQVWLSVVPPTSTTDITTRSACVAIPRVLGRRTKEVLTLWRRAALERLRNGPSV
ncbi:nucleotidyltransferase domain-containing protein [Nocardioides piscis]|uniref:Nucleotidyltransferase family protein n=1 Tax=Nocardioides piscis TaxID=2714938 RepID=A0A6G7YF09_9ACTN|nr:nucleotidyltransferase family protein [Nocardioides piscis]QIK75228.1 nucleotidyltransferase family protein [Nocardioides piscis]